MKTLLQALRLLAVLTVLTGVLYPLAVTVAARLLFPDCAEGSLLLRHGKPVGSELLAQRFENPRYFWPRPSAGNGVASHLGPTHSLLRKAVAERREKFGAGAPVEMLTASGSGLDPHISPEAALQQAARVAVARGLSPEEVARLVDALAEPPQFGIFGEPRVNVLFLNLLLDEIK